MPSTCIIPSIKKFIRIPKRLGFNTPLLRDDRIVIRYECQTSPWYSTIIVRGSLAIRTRLCAICPYHSAVITRYDP